MTAPRIVILDNDSFSLGALHDPLAAAGYRTLRCRPQDVVDAHALVRRARADLVILDRWLAKREDGWTFLKRLWGDAETAQIPAVIVAGESDVLPVHPDAMHALHCRVVYKPFGGQDLLDAIAAVLGPSPVQWARSPRLHAVLGEDRLVPEFVSSSLIAAMGEGS